MSSAELHQKTLDLHQALLAELDLIDDLAGVAHGKGEAAQASLNTDLYLLHVEVERRVRSIKQRLEAM